MSRAFSDIQNLLEAQLVSLGLGYAVAWDNVDFTPNPTTPWLNPTIIPAGGQAAGLGVTAQNRHDGIFQITVMAPARDGHSLGLQIADQLATGFKRGLNLVTGNTRLVVTAVARNSSGDDGDWFHVPVSISFYAYADN